MKTYIKGNISTIIYNNEQNGYTVGIFKIKETNSTDEELLNCVKKTISFVGTFHEIKEKANYLFYGQTIVHPKYGYQFQVSEYEIIKPEKKEEIISFLASDLFPIGEKTAENIYKKLGNNAIEEIINDKNVLNNIPRLKEDKIDIIYKTLKDYQYSNTIILTLTEYGFTLKQALSVYAKYKNKTLDVINENVYDLIESLEIPFKDIDNIASNLQIPKDDDRRLSALIIYIITNICFNLGSTYVLLEEIQKEITKYIDTLELDELEYLLIKLNKKGKIKIKDNKYYLSMFYNAENYIAKRLCELNKISSKNKKNIVNYISTLEKENNITYDETQKEAIIKAVTNNLTVITGGPGTGKTTIIKCIVNILKDILKVEDDEIALLSPTGRAAKRMSESVLMPAYTIHRFLKWDMDNNSFSVNELNKAKEKYIIVDEASMVDTIIAESLLKGLRQDVKLILVGDYNQLPSVREGQVLKDIIDSGIINVIFLKSLYRQNENSYINQLAKEVKIKDLSKNFTEKKDDYNFIEADSSKVKDIIINIIDKALSKGYDDTKIQVLAPMYKGENGIDILNKTLKEKFNPPSYDKKEIIISDTTSRVGDKVLQLVNDPDENVYNGDIGYIVDIVSSKKSKSKRNELHINFYGNIVIYTPAKYINITHGYAVSIHKSQGSEFDMVIIPIVSSFKRMLYNKLIYTGITRAKKTLILVGDKNSFIYSVNNDTMNERRTTLKELLINKYNN